jgi:hypothetical protein
MASELNPDGWNRLYASAAGPQYPPAILDLLARHGIKPPAPQNYEKQIDVRDLDRHLAARNTTISDRFAVKAALRQVGLLGD